MAKLPQDGPELQYNQSDLWQDIETTTLAATIILDENSLRLEKNVLFYRSSIFTLQSYGKY